MSTYYSFLNKIFSYLRSVRKLKTHVSYDLIFPDKWVIPKNNQSKIEIIRNSSEGGIVDLSFVCLMNEEQVSNTEKYIDNIIKINLEREEKEKLFRSKVNELKSMFDKQTLEELNMLKFILDRPVESQFSDNDEEYGEIESRD